MTRTFTPALNASGGTPREVSDRVNRLIAGKINSVGSITLTDGSATSTTLSDINIGPDSVIFLMPTTLNAAAYVNVTYVSAKARGQATLTHSANSAADRTFDYVVLG